MITNKEIDRKQDAMFLTWPAAGTQERSQLICVTNLVTNDKIDQNTVHNFPNLEMYISNPVNNDV